VHIDRDAATVVAYGNGSVSLYPDVNMVGVASQSFVNAVVDNLVDHVVQTGTIIGVADVHPRTLADRL